MLISVAVTVSEETQLKRNIRLTKKAITDTKRQLSALEKRLVTEEKALAKVQSSAPTESKPKRNPRVTTGNSVINLKDHAEFKKSLMKGPIWFEAINGRSKRRANIEGYWREEFNKKLGTLPFPVIMDIPSYNKAAFIKKLKSLQSKARRSQYKGYSPNRWTGGNAGTDEFTLNGWSWPSGLTGYLSAGVPPSRAFYKFVTGRSLKALPTYGRE